MTTTAWTKTTLGEVTEIVSGGTPKTSVPQNWDGGIPWATPKDLSNLSQATISGTPRTLSQQGLASCGATLMPAGSVLLSSRAPIGHVAINTVPMATNQGFKSFVLDDHQVDPKFLFWWLKRHRPMLESLGNGATFKEISKKVTAAVPIELPPIEEQRRIAAVLDSADALRVKRRQAIAKLDSLTQGIFIDMFGDPHNASTEATLSDYADVVTGNTPPRKQTENFSDVGIDWIKSGDIKPTGLVEESAERLSATGESKGRIAPSGSTLVVCIAGSPESIGRVGLLDRRAAFNQQINAVIPGPDLLPEFMFHQLKAGKRQVQRASTNSMKGMVSKSALQAIPVLVPPLAEQRQFVRAADGARSMTISLRNSETELDTLFASLQQRAFRGEL